MSSAATALAQIAEEAWALNQQLVHEDCIGIEADLDRLRRSLAQLAMLVHQLAEEADDAAK